MAYKEAHYIVVDSESYYGFKDTQKLAVASTESCSDVHRYIVISNGEIVVDICEDDCASKETSIIDALYTLKHNLNDKDVKDDLSRDTIDKLFKDDIINSELKDKVK